MQHLKAAWRKDFKEQWCRKNYLILLHYFLASCILIIVMEGLSRRSVWKPAVFIYRHPLVFIYNALLVYFTLCFSLLVRKRGFTFILISGLWLGICIANCILMSFRSMPLTARDIMLMSSVKEIFEIYLSPLVLILLMLLISALWALIFAIWALCKSQNGIFHFAIVHILLTLVILAGAGQVLVSFDYIDDTTEFYNLAQAYERNGFAYCFSTSVTTGGVDEPEDYSEEHVEEILREQDKLSDTAEDLPNIIFVQLESFFDPYFMKDLEYEYDPIPNFRSLKEQYPSGLLSVPCVGAGTANTEFEVLTGMNLNHFGVGEYPYASIVNSASPESLASVLRGLGYGTHAVHNNNATFYDRDVVYNNLSFETYTPLEYMSNVEYNALGWAKDSVLTGEILKCLESNDEKNFVFAVSVQPHGRYPKKEQEDTDSITVSGIEDNGRQIGFEYYLYELYEADRFVGELIHALETYEEKTVVVFYGDHLPSFNIQEEELKYGTNQTTEYVVWSNYSLDIEPRELQTYQLSAYILEACEIYEGAIFRLHQMCDFPQKVDDNYQEDLQTLEYDMIYGEQYSTNASLIDSSSFSLQYDVESIRVIEVILEEEGGFTVKGENFTTYSKIYINGSPCATEYISEEALRTQSASIRAGDEITVVQISAADELELLGVSNGIWIPDNP